MKCDRSEFWWTARTLVHSWQQHIPCINSEDVYFEPLRQRNAMHFTVIYTREMRVERRFFRSFLRHPGDKGVMDIFCTKDHKELGKCLSCLTCMVLILTYINGLFELHRLHRTGSGEEGSQFQAQPSLKTFWPCANFNLIFVGNLLSRGNKTDTHDFGTHEQSKVLSRV